MQITSCNVFVHQRPEVANSGSVKVNEPGRLYFDVTCRFTLYWVFDDISDVVFGSVTSIQYNNLIVTDLQSIPLKGIVRSSEDGLLYLFPVQNLSTLQEMKGYLTCAIDVLSNPDENDTEKRLDAARTLNSPVAALGVNDGDYYDAIDTALEETRG